MVTIADASDSPTEIRILNKAEPLLIGQDGSKSSSLAAVLSELTIERTGLTNICKQIRDIAKQLQDMESIRDDKSKIALLIIMAGGESSDGSIADALGSLEGLRVQIIIRICTDESSVIEYWENANSQVDLDILILHDVRSEALAVARNNSWLTYGEPLHRLREFGVMVPAVDLLGYRQLSRHEIQTVAQTL